MMPGKGISVSVLPFRRVRKYWKMFRHLAYFFLVLREGMKADVIYAQDPISVGLPSAIAAFFLRKPFLLKVVGDYAWEQASQRFGYGRTPDSFQEADVSFFARALRTLERWVAARARAVIVPSKYLGTLVRAWGIPKQKIKVILNGVEDFGDTGNKQVLRGLIKFHGKLLISAGRLVPWKGFAGLIEMLSILKREFTDIKLLIVGGGPGMANLEEKAVAAGVGGDIIFTGPLERDILLRYIRASDVFVLNTAYEGLSHQILEVMAVGVPVVSTRVGGNPEIIDHGIDGFLAKHNDIPALAKHTGGLLRDAALRAKIVAAGKKKVRQFSNERMVAETAQFLKKICAS
jgi:glycosyltransferase involved in cell wall biosynthesis